MPQINQQSEPKLEAFSVNNMEQIVCTSQQVQQDYLKRFKFAPCLFYISLLLW